MTRSIGTQISGVFHWNVSYRIDFLKQSPVTTSSLLVSFLYLVTNISCRRQSGNCDFFFSCSFLRKSKQFFYPIIAKSKIAWVIDHNFCNVVTGGSYSRYLGNLGKNVVVDR